MENNQTVVGNKEICPSCKHEFNTLADGYGFGIRSCEPDCAIGNAMILKYEDSDSAIECWNRRAK